MRIVIVSQYFWPESFIINDLAKKLVDAGHAVTVITGKPNYPSGKIFKGYSFWGIKKEEYYGVNIIRVPLVPRGEGSGVRLAINYLSFVFFASSVLPVFFSRKQIDSVFVFAPSPITTAIPAVLLKWFSKASLSIWVQDLWPESLQSTGFIKNGIAIRFVRWLVKWIYKHTDRLLLQSEAFIGPVSILADKSQLIYYPNSIDAKLYQPAKGKVSSRIADVICLLNKKFSVVFAGNIGTAQSIDTILSASEMLSELSVDVQFVLAGSGSMMAWAVKEKELKKLANIHFVGRFEPDEMPPILFKADCLLVTLKDEPIFSYTIPSKVQAYMAAGRPIVAALNGEGSRIVTESGAGFACKAESASELVDTILRMKRCSQEQRSEMGRNARQYFDMNFDMDCMTERLVEILNNEQ